MSPPTAVVAVAANVPGLGGSAGVARAARPAELRGSIVMIRVITTISCEAGRGTFSDFRLNFFAEFLRIILCEWSVYSRYAVPILFL